jgi:hypothetical protein
VSVPAARPPVHWRQAAHRRRHGETVQALDRSPHGEWSKHWQARARQGPALRALAEANTPPGAWAGGDPPGGHATPLFCLGGGTLRSAKPAAGTRFAKLLNRIEAPVRRFRAPPRRASESAGRGDRKVRIRLTRAAGRAAPFRAPVSRALLTGVVHWRCLHARFTGATYRRDLQARFTGAIYTANYTGALHCRALSTGV